LSKPIWHQCAQGSDEWHHLRLGRITGSRFSDVMARGRAGDDFGATAESYAIELLVERLTKKPQDMLKLRETEWGLEHEAAARLAYCFAAGVRIDKVGFAIHGDLPEVGISVDGLVGTDGIIEIKCPYNSKIHLRNMRYRRVPTEYRAQVQGGLWILDRKWCDFISYDPRLPDDFNLAVIRVGRDDEFIEQLAERCEKFSTFVQKFKSALVQSQRSSHVN
jgi:putative phage-type endonuclease